MRAEDYDYLHELEEDFWWFVGMREITATLLDPLCPPGRDRMILDAGCGTGGMLSWLERYVGNGKIFGIDLEQQPLDYCRGRGHSALARASVTGLPFDDQTFDLVTSFDVLVQIPGEDSDALAAREMFRVLRPGGLAFVRAAAYGWMMSGHDAALGTQRRYNLGGLASLLEEAGFKVLRPTYANCFLFPVAVLRRMLLKRIKLADSGSDVKPLPRRAGWLNHALAGALRVEARALARMRSGLPFGLSAICVAQRPPD